jgi:hypothetical protein
MKTSYFDRHPWVAALLIVSIFLLVSTSDFSEQEAVDAYELGYSNGLQVAVGPEQDEINQIAVLCSKEWPADSVAARAKARACHQG